ncbi:hypothetical protein D3C84_143910 [compost metagenome]
MTDLFGVLVFLAADRVTAPAHDNLGFHAGAQGAGVAQQVEYVVADALRGVEVDALAVQFVLGVHDVTQGAEQHFTGAGDHFAVDEGVRRCVEQLQAYTTVLLMNANLEVPIGFQNGLGVVDMGAGIEDGQGALAKERVDAA